MWITPQSALPAEISTNSSLSMNKRWAAPPPCGIHCGTSRSAHRYCSLTPDPLINRRRFWLLPPVSGCVPLSGSTSHTSLLTRPQKRPSQASGAPYSWANWGNSRDRKRRRVGYRSDCVSQMWHRPARRRAVLRFCGSRMARRAVGHADHRLAPVVNQNGAAIVLELEGW